MAADKKLGETFFKYIDELRETARQIVKYPSSLCSFLAMWTEEVGLHVTDNNVAPFLPPLNLPYQGIYALCTVFYDELIVSVGSLCGLSSLQLSICGKLN